MNSTPERLSLPLLQSKMKCDPEGYECELVLLYNQFKSSMELFKQQASLHFTSVGGIGSDPSVAKDLSDRAMFLAHVTPFYSKHLVEFPKQLADLLNSSSKSLPSGLRCHIAQALILLMNRKMVDIEENLALFMELQTLGDRTLRKLAFSHVIHSIKRMNQKHKNEAKNRALQKILFALLQQEDEAKAKRSLITLCELHRRKVWFDERTANAICTACFHSSPRIMIAALSFLLDYEKIEDGEDDSDEESGEDDVSSQSPHVVLSKELVYKAHNKGTSSSKKKKKAKLQRVMRSMKRQQRVSSDRNNSYYSPLNHLKDAQGFAEKLFSRLHACHERFEVKMMMLKVIARTVGLHRLILLSFYPYLQKYVQPHQRDITSLLAAAVQACHDVVPPDAVEPLFKQIVNQFVHDRSRTEAIAVGLNVVREICLRMPLLMTEDLLQDLALYKKSHEKAISVAARSLIGLFREICPSLLVKKDRGRPTDPKAKPKAYGEVSVASDIPGIELLQDDDGVNSDDDDDDCETIATGSDDDLEQVVDSSDDGDNQIYSDSGTDDEDELTEDGSAPKVDSDEGTDDDENANDSSELELETDEEAEDSGDEPDAMSDEIVETGSVDARTTSRDSKLKKRKHSDFDQQFLTANSSLRALKKLASTVEGKSSEPTDGILSNEDFRRIKELKAKKDAKSALTQHGLLRNAPDAKSTAFKVPSTDELSTKRMDPSKLEVHIRRRMSKEEKLALVKAGREDRGKYQARAAVKQKKTGGLSNRQKEHKKAMPLAAKRSRVAKSRVDKRKKDQRSGKQFRGKKAWKQ
ncbi:protein SDA1 homolog [Cucurbita pepo subsp. pepo]|uniref:protein SDA1 homolog n=1 Tax=Cucurbita pepo subsp. pepo TaxID=3664 RepID=UPI000C9D84AA|nr:protein SDA1 homolog [Cucurbita pepo subsp. pepo]